MLILYIAPCGTAFCEAVYDCGGARICLVSATLSDSGAVIVISMQADEDTELILTEPMVNDMPGWFDSGWCADEYTAGSSETEYTIGFETDEDTGVIERVSFRVIENGVISSRVIIRGIGEGAPVLEYGIEEDTRLTSADITVTDRLVRGGITLRHNITPQQLEILDYCKVMVFSVNDDGTMSLVATVAAEADGNGEVTAVWSGYTLSIGEYSAAVPVAEDGKGRMRLSGTLLGDYLYYSAVDIDIDISGENAVFAGTWLASPELSQECGNVPLSLFNSFEVSPVAYEYGDDWLRSVVYTDVSVDLSEPLGITLTGVRDGENLVYCFVYYFNDFTTGMSGIIPLNTKNDQGD